VCVTEAGLQPGREGRTLAFGLLLLPGPGLLLPVTAAGPVLGLLLEGVDGRLLHGELLHRHHHAVVGVQSPQLVRLLGKGLQVLVVHLGEQDPNLPGQPA
jgi:hypothetical protein